MPIDHWMMFGTFAEQRHFVYPTKETYQGAIINGNMAAHAPHGLAAFLLEKTASLKYIIDPLTHAFQHDPEFIVNKDGEPKTSIKSLAEIYGLPTDGLVGRSPVLPADFDDDDYFGNSSSVACIFRIENLQYLMAESDAMKYLDVQPAELRPYALIPPYFYMTEATYKVWLPVAIRAIEAARAEYTSASTLCVNRD